MGNKKKDLSGLLKDMVTLIFKWLFGLSLGITIIIQFRIIPNFFMVVFDLLLVTAIIIKENLFKFPKDPRNDTYVFYINVALFLLMVVIFYQYWDIVKRFFMIE
ncbi:MAG: hypothetical protein J6L86_07745 [Alphaproteobacteria bacterium]|nr:hypothetical protein [Alphaproteobacteria bacterium]MBQ8630570.1 hypothetical protein [Alphaproteobacteria bacterium]